MRELMHFIGGKPVAASEAEVASAVDSAATAQRG